MSDTASGIPTTTELAAGSVVLLCDQLGEELLAAVVRRVSSEVLTVVPISAAVELATEWDLLLSPTTLGYAAMAQVWNFGSVLPEQVVAVVAGLAEGERGMLDALAEAARTGGAVPGGMPVGPPVLEDVDPRLLHQDAAAERARAYQLVHHRREELGIDADELETLSPVDGWLGALEGDVLDVRRALPSSALAELMRRLQLRASRRLGRIAVWTIEGRAPTLARNRAAVQAADDVPSAHEYVAAVLRDLEGH
jgi:hypothetical protein